MSPLADLLAAKGWSLGIAESLTGGLLTDAAAQLPNASDWLRGGLVAYNPQVKREVLDIGDSPVVSEQAALAMVASVARLLGADVAVAVTGVGGPDPEDGIAPGSVWIATHVPGTTGAQFRRFTGSTRQIIEATCSSALGAVIAALTTDDALSEPTAARR